MSEPGVATYPPEQHVLRDLGLTTELGPGLVTRGEIPIGSELRTPSGVTHAGALATLVDVLGGGLAATAAQPDWIATADLTLHVLARRDVTCVDAVGRVIRQGRTTVVVDVELTADGTELGLATMTFAVLPRRDGNPVIPDTDTVSRMTMALPGSGFRTPLELSAGIVRTDPDAGCLHLPISDYVRNSLGAVQGGMMAMTAAAAAEGALSAAAGSSLAAVDLHVTYLTLAKVGPVRSDTTVLAATPAFGTAHVELVDEGAGDALCTLVRARAVRVP